MTSKKIKDFQFDFMIIVLLGAAVSAGIAILIQVVAWIYNIFWLKTNNYSPTAIYSDEIIQLIIFLVGFAGSWIAARKILPGSPELTHPDLMEYDNSLTKKEKNKGTDI